VSDGVRRFLSDLRILEHGVSMRIGTSIWGRQDISFREEFLFCARNAFRSEVFSRDFGDPAVLDEINAWVRENTGGRIARLLEGLSPGLMLTLINAAGFKGAWTIPFDKNQTTDEAFTLANGSTVTVPMMRRSGEFAYFETSMFQACALPYGETGSYSMYIVLPRPDSSLRQLHDALTPALWNKIVQPRSANCEGTVYLPRFRIDAGRELSTLLSRLGLETMFSTRADFSAMASVRDPLFFDQVIHKVFVDVNEEGTEVAAATGLEMMGGMFQLDPAPPFTMKIDRPFFCAIGSGNGAAMFLGAIHDPAASS
jgi:serpin B